MRVASGPRGRGAAKPAGRASRLFSGKPAANRSIADVWDSTFDDSADMVLLLDGDLAIIKANRAFARTSGRELEDLVGRKCHEIIRGITELPPVPSNPEPLAGAGRAVEVFYVARIGSRFLLSLPPASVDLGRLLYCIRVALEIIGGQIPERTPRIGHDLEGVRDEGQERLTPRQNEILRLLCEGLLVKEIAFQLKISARTVEFHKRKMMENIGMKTFAELIKYAIRKGIVT